MTLTFSVDGMTPAPQGSKRHVGHGVLVESCAQLKPWRQAVSAAALEARSQQGIQAVFSGPCTLSVVFRFPRPKGHYGKTGLRPSAPIWKATKPDLDKCLRSTADALSHVLIRDDSQIVSISAAKRWVGVDETPGCTITLIPHLDVQAPRC